MICNVTHAFHTIHMHTPTIRTRGGQPTTVIMAPITIASYPILYFYIQP